MKHTEVEVTLALAAEHGLNSEEYGKICTILGRTPVSYTHLTLPTKA